MPNPGLTTMLVQTAPAATSGSFSTSQVTVTASITPLVPANPNRNFLEIRNNGTGPIFIAGTTTSPTLSTTTGHQINGGGVFTMQDPHWTGPIYGIATSSFSASYVDIG